MGKIMLCADASSAKRPELLGLPEVDLQTADWLEVYSDAIRARMRVRNAEDIDEVWVASADSVAAVNLAAALRKDAPALRLTIVLSELSGSALSCAQAAGVNGILTTQGFPERFFIEVRRRATMQEVAAKTPEAVAATCALGSTGIMSYAGTTEANDPEIPSPISTANSPGSSNPVSSSVPAPSCGLSMPDASAQSVHPGQQAKGNADAFILTILSGSGGAGKSTVAAVSAHRAAQRGCKVVMVDCDLQFGDLHQLVGCSTPLTIDDALSDPEQIPRLAAAATKGVPSLIAAPKRLERSEMLAKHLNATLDMCVASFDVVVVNTGASWAEYHAALLERSTCALFLIDQRASSIRACQHALDLTMRLGVATGSFAFALNRCQRGSLFTSIDIACVMQGAHVFELKEGGAEIEELLGAGRVAEIADTRNEFCQSIDAMLDELLPLGEATAKAEAQLSHCASDSLSRKSGRMKRRRGSRKSSRRRGAREAEEAFVAALSGMPTGAAFANTETKVAL